MTKRSGLLTEWVFYKQVADTVTHLHGKEFILHNFLDIKHGCLEYIGLVLIAVMKHHDQKQLGEDRVYFILHFQIRAHRWGMSRRELGEPWKVLRLIAFSSCAPLPGPSPRGTQPTVTCSPITNQENAQKVCLGWSDWDIFSMGLPLSDDWLLSSWASLYMKGFSIDAKSINMYSGICGDIYEFCPYFL